MRRMRELETKVQQLEKQINQLQKPERYISLQKAYVKERQEKIFNKYSFDYSDEPDLSSRKRSVELQRMVFDNLNERGLENTAIEKLLDMTLEDIECQHTIKSGIENKAGFILALWGILLSLLFANDNFLLVQIISTIIAFEFKKSIFYVACVLVVALGITGIVSLYYIYQSIKPHTYKKFPFDSKEENFMSAAENKNITYTTLLDNVTNSWKQNREIINDIAKKYHKSIKWIIAFALAIVASYLFLA